MDTTPGLVLSALLLLSGSLAGQAAKPERAGRYNVLFIISDDLTDTALSCYGNKVCSTPNIDALASRGVRFTRAYCQGTYCGPSRASFMSGYYPHAIRMLGYKSPRPMIGDRATWAGHFKAAGYHTARVSKIFHMGVPGGIEKGTDGADDPRSWTERFNCQGPEWRAPGTGETLEGNPDGRKPVVGGNTFVVVAADGDDSVHADGKAAAKACELIARYKADGRRFWLGVGFVRPHVPFVSPRGYHAAFPHGAMRLPERIDGDWDDIPKAGINYKTSANMQMDPGRQKKAIAGYYAAVAFMDAQVGKVMAALRDAGLVDETIVIFTSDHGYHLGEHDFWAKVSLHEESARVPLIVCVPGKAPAVCGSFVELLDLFPTVAALCGLEVPARLQGADVSPMFDDPKHRVRDAVFSVNGKGFLLRTERWAYMQYGEDGKGGAELYDMQADPQQFHNLAGSGRHARVVAGFRERLAAKLRAVRSNDLGLLRPAPRRRGPEPGGQSGARFGLVCDQEAVVPGQALTVGLHIEHAPGWHTYWRNPGTVGLPTRIDWTLPEGCAAGPIQWQRPQSTRMGVYTVWGYEDRALLLTDITVPRELAGERFTLRAKVTYMACARSCHPGTEELTLALPRGDVPGRSREWGARFDAVRDQQPRVLRDVWQASAERRGDRVVLTLAPTEGGRRAVNLDPGEVAFFADERVVSSDAAQELRRHGDRLELRMERERSTPAETDRLRGVLYCDLGFLRDGSATAMRIDVPL